MSNRVLTELPNFEVDAEKYAVTCPICKAVASLENLRGKCRIDEIISTKCNTCGYSRSIERPRIPERP
jgi:hypothetical protein